MKLAQAHEVDVAPGTLKLRINQQRSHGGRAAEGWTGTTILGGGQLPRGRPTRRRGAAAAVSMSLWWGKGSDVIQKAGDASFTVCSQASSQKQSLDRAEGCRPSMGGATLPPSSVHMRGVSEGEHQAER